MEEILKRQIRPPEYISIEQIVSEVPYQNMESPSSWELYLYYNKDILDENEKANVRAVVDKLKKERDMVFERNVEYFEKNKE